MLGAGNCNDLDLGRLLELHESIALVDLDFAALTSGVEKQHFSGCTSIQPIGGVDLTGILDVISGWSSNASIPASDIAALAEWPSQRVARTLCGTYDVVASTCLLSQIIGNAFRVVGGQHPQFMDVVRAIRVGHLRLMAELCKPGGRVVLITDVVSSDIAPTLKTTAESDLAVLLPALIRNGQFINGVNPEAIALTFRTDPILNSVVVGLERTAPWFWRLHERLYVVLAFQYRKSSASLLSI